MAILFYDLCGRDPALRFSPYCWRARMALAHKGLSVETVPTPFTEIAKVENGASATVPVINDGRAIVRDSFEIALYLDRTYPDPPALFAGDAGVAACRLIESWAFTTIHPIIMRMMARDIHDALCDADQTYFRSSRETRFGRTLEEHQTGVEANTEALIKALEPPRHALASFDWLGGGMPGFADFIVFGSLMWLRSIAGAVPLAADDRVALWFARCLDLNGGLARGARRAEAA
jgi:glutathione S-transferase